MRQLSSSGQQAVDDIARHHGFGVEATRNMLDAVIRGNGRQAQFSHPEFSGSGQWMRGGMTMVSDMFNSHLKGRVDALCSELSNLLLSQPELACSGASGDWWPSDLRWPDSTGAQNGARYACFSQARRLVIEFDGRVTVYDTLDHRITGVSQQQSDGGTLGFSSQFGTVDVASLPIVSVDGVTPYVSMNTPVPSGHLQANQNSHATQDIFSTIERLADLRAKGILSEDEFASKKTELLSRV
ncbi:SHOCT domain-containing protein [Variovorax sp. RHLX14]|uniref:SHOCT domain-containing protein n=1 Tax=Variovorax sp. RHLX14 TaxID=1259731 RepID=UPI003F45DBFA